MAERKGDRQNKRKEANEWVRGQEGIREREREKQRESKREKDTITPRVIERRIKIVCIETFTVLSTVIQYNNKNTN